MSIIDKVKAMFGKNKSKVKDGIDKAAGAVQSKTPDSVDGKVEAAADAAKNVVDKLD